MKITKLSIFIVVVVVSIFLSLIVIKLTTLEDGWLCQNGAWVSHGHPASGPPLDVCPVILDRGSEPETLIRLLNLESGDLVSSPLIITGEARGSWFFEASFPVRIEDASGRQLASSFATAEGDWMTEDFVPFLASLEFNVATQTDAFLILEKDNPSGLKEYDNQMRLPVRLEPTDTMMVKVFFSNSQLDAESSCDRVFAVTRIIPRTVTVARASLEELFKGVNREEECLGYFSNLNEEIGINHLEISGSTALVDFSSQLGVGVAGSCRVSAIRSQIVETLRQFDSISDVIISVDGNKEETLQP